MPLRETAFQGYTFLALAYAGSGCALLFDLMSPLLNSRLAALRVIADLLLCAASSLLILLTLSLTGAGSLRLYMAAAFAAGAAVYRLGVRRVIAAVINLLRKNRNSRKESE